MVKTRQLGRYSFVLNCDFDTTQDELMQALADEFSRVENGEPVYGYTSSSVKDWSFSNNYCKVVQLFGKNFDGSNKILTIRSLNGWLSISHGSDKNLFHENPSFGASWSWNSKHLSTSSFGYNNFRFYSSRNLINGYRTALYIFAHPRYVILYPKVLGKDVSTMHAHSCISAVAAFDLGNSQVTNNFPIDSPGIVSQMANLNMQSVVSNYFYRPFIEYRQFNFNNYIGENVYDTIDRNESLQSHQEYLEAVVGSKFGFFAYNSLDDALGNSCQSLRAKMKWHAGYETTKADWADEFPIIGLKSVPSNLNLNFLDKIFIKCDENFELDEVNGVPTEHTVLHFKNSVGANANKNTYYLIPS